MVSRKKPYIGTADFTNEKALKKALMGHKKRKQKMRTQKDKNNEQLTMETAFDDSSGEYVFDDDELRHKLWSVSGGNTLYFPVSETCETLPPDVYEPCVNQGSPFFYRVHFSTEDLVLFEDDTIEKVVGQIRQFWDCKKKFDDFGFPYRRGILLYGPAGGGKTSTLKFILNDVIKMGGVGLIFNNPNVYTLCMRTLRTIHPDMPVIVAMEDIDGIMRTWNESDILNILDGVDGFDNIVYLATTNYPEELEGRIKNRPSRFDRRYKVGYPNENSRRMYIEHLMSKMTDEHSKSLDVERWVKDTDNFTPAHIKELFISVVLYDEEYKKAIEMLLEMQKNITSDDDNFGKKAGFGRAGFGRNGVHQDGKY